MRRFLSGALLVAIGSLAAGCLVLEKRPGRTTAVSRSVVAAPPSCHPSQYWDGNQCRHKGKGHGARKHDGRR